MMFSNYTLLLLIVVATFLLLRITYFCTVWLSLCLGKQLTFAVLNAYIPTLCTAMMPPSESRPILGWLAEVYVHSIDLSVANCTIHKNKIITVNIHNTAFNLPTPVNLPVQYT